MATPDLVEELWREQSCWSRTANRMKRRIERARFVALVLVVAVAVSGTTAAVLAGLDGAAPVWGRVLAGVAAAGAAALPLLRPAWSGTRLRDWTRARSVSEALKSDVYLWLAGVGPHHGSIDALRTATDRLRADAADLVRHRHGVEPEQRHLPPVRDPVGYFTHRVRAQATGYYQPRADRIQASLRRFRLAEIALAVAAALVGVIAAAVGASLAAWVTVIATAGTALAVHVSAGRFEFQLIEFQRTAERLRQLDRAAGATTDRAVLAALAVQAENVISVENQGWMAKLAEDPPALSA